MVEDYALAELSTVRESFRALFPVSPVLGEGEACRVVSAGGGDAGGSIEDQEEEKLAAMSPLLPMVRGNSSHKRRGISVSPRALEKKAGERIQGWVCGA